MFRRILLAATLVAGSAQADHYYETADPQLVQGLNEMVYVLGGACQAGDPQACQAIGYVQQQGHAMLSAGYDCQHGMPQACAFYHQQIGQFWQGYQMLSARVQGGGFAPAQGYGQSDHAERMQQIHNWGQQRLDWGRQQSQMMDDNHRRFLETLRQ